MKREREGVGRESKRERRGGESWGGGVGGERKGGRWVKKGVGGNTGTSHELNRTANSSTREGGGGGGRRGWRGWRGGGIRRGRVFFLSGGGWEGRGRGGDRSLLHYTTHTYTHTKKTGHKLHFRSKLRLKSDDSVLCVFKFWKYFF